MCKQQSDWSHNGSKQIFNHWSPSGSHGRNLVYTKIRYDTNDSKLKGLVKLIKSNSHCFILHAKNIGSWLTVRSTTVTTTVLAATSFRDFLCARYDFTPPNLPKICDSCYQSFSVRHVLSFSHWGLVISCRNEVCYELLYLARQAFPSNCVWGEPFIRQVHSRSDEEVRQGRGGFDTRGDVLVRGLWESQTYSIINVRFGDTDADTYNKDPMDNLLDSCYKWNKDKHGKHFHNQCKLFLCLSSQCMAF